MGGPARRVVERRSGGSYRSDRSSGGGRPLENTSKYTTNHQIVQMRRPASDGGRVYESARSRVIKEAKKKTHLVTFAATRRQLKVGGAGLGVGGGGGKFGRLLQEDLEKSLWGQELLPQVQTIASQNF